MNEEVQIISIADAAAASVPFSSTSENKLLFNLLTRESPNDQVDTAKAHLKNTIVQALWRAKLDTGCIRSLEVSYTCGKFDDRSGAEGRLHSAPLGTVCYCVFLRNCVRR